MIWLLLTGTIAIQDLLVDLLMIANTIFSTLLEMVKNHTLKKPTKTNSKCPLFREFHIASELDLETHAHKVCGLMRLAAVSVLLPKHQQHQLRFVKLMMKSLSNSRLANKTIKTVRIASMNLKSLVMITMLNQLNISTIEANTASTTPIQLSTTLSK